jgi:hypothetical protein
VLLACRIAPPLLVHITACRYDYRDPGAAGISLLPVSCHHYFTVTPSGIAACAPGFPEHFLIFDADQ